MSFFMLLLSFLRECFLWMLLLMIMKEVECFEFGLWLVVVVYNVIIVVAVNDNERNLWNVLSLVSVLLRFVQLRLQSAEKGCYPEIVFTLSRLLTVVLVFSLSFLILFLLLFCFCKGGMILPRFVFFRLWRHFIDVFYIVIVVVLACIIYLCCCCYWWGGMIPQECLQIVETFHSRLVSSFTA